MRQAVLAILLQASVALAGELDAVRITAKENLPGLPIARQQEILESLRRSGPGGSALSAYYLPKSDPAFAWVNPELLDRLYEMSAPGSETNCYWTSHFAHGVVRLPERYMGLEEYLSLLATHYRLATQPEPGDVLRLRRVRGGMDTHSVAYLGTLRGVDWVKLVLTKNGPKDGPYLVMDLSDLETRVYPGSRIAEIHRPADFAEACAPRR
jgi:hypothetical protein